jgi:hypothetical protein
MAEIAVPQASRAIDLSVLQNELKGRFDEIVLFAFDLLYLNGYDLGQLPLFERKAHFKKLFDGTDGQPQCGKSERSVSCRLTPSTFGHSVQRELRARPPEMLKSENWDLSIGFKGDYAHAGAHLVGYRDGAVHAYKLGPSFS